MPSNLHSDRATRAEAPDRAGPLNRAMAGWHLIVDATVADPIPISSADHLRDTLTELVDLLGMQILDGPRMTEVDLEPARIELDEDEGGITGYCLITTSHISIHTWPLRGRFSFDAFSCRPFDRDAALRFIRERLSVDQESVTWIERHWPGDLRRSSNSVDPAATRV